MRRMVRWGVPKGLAGQDEERAGSPPRRPRGDAATGASPGVNALPATPNTPNNALGADAEYRPPAAIIETIVNYLVRAASSAPDGQDRRGTSHACRVHLTP
jgi:hypothetical protein